MRVKRLDVRIVALEVMTNILVGGRRPNQSTAKRYYD